MSDSDEHLRDRLRALSSDLSNAWLPGPRDARHRGAQRIRNEVTGKVLAGVAVAAVGVVGVTPAMMPDGPGQSGSAGGAESQTAARADAQPLDLGDDGGPALPADPLLSDDDVDPIGTYEGFRRVDGHPQDPRFDFRCLDDLAAAGAAEFVEGYWFHEWDGSFSEFVMRMPDDQRALRIITGHTVLPDQCGDVGPTHEQTVGEPAVIEVDGADGALVWTVETAPLPEDPGSAGSFHAVGMASQADVVVVIAFGAMDDPTGGGWPQYARRTLALALDRAIQRPHGSTD